MPYPLISEYVESIKSAKDNFDELTNLRPVLNDDGTPVMSSGNFAVVFKMQDTQTGKFHAVRCFHREQAGWAESYRLIEAELSNVSSPYIVSFRYMERELFVDSSQTQETEFPVLLMDWVEGVTLDKYLREHIADQRALDMLAYHFSQLAVWLMPQPFAHGDLKPDNILVRPDGTPVLVDYDGMFVPAMQGQQARELGSPDFRHPLRTEDDFGERMDDFSLISILLSLKLTALHPEYFAEYGASDRLLFSAKDYADIANCQLLKAVFPSADAELNRLASLFMLCHSTKNLANVSFVLLSIEKPIKFSNFEQYGDSLMFSDEELTCITGCKAIYYHDEDFAKLHITMNLNGIVKTIKEDLTFDERKEDGIILDVTSIERLGFEFNNEININPRQVVFYKMRNVKSGKEIARARVLKEIPKELSTKVTDEDLANAWIDEYGVKYSQDRKRLLKFTNTKLEGYVILEGTNIICDCAFLGGSSLKEITLPNSLTSIGSYVFNGCSFLREIIIPEPVANMGANPFFRCKCSIKCKSPHYLYENGILYTAAKDKVISCTTDNITIILPNSVKTIGDNAFSWCRSLHEIIIPDSVKTIGDDAFFCCSSLQKITLPDSVATIGDSAFFDCSSLHEITLPDSVTTIGDDAFSWCRFLHEIIIPDTVANIGRNPFLGCKCSIKCKSSYYLYENGMLYTAAKDKVISCTTDNTTIVLPDSVTSIGDGAFHGCSSLHEIIIPDSVTSIGDSAFWHCSSLHEITLPNSVTTIGDMHFWGCFSLERIIIPRNTREKFEKLLPNYKDKLVEQ